MSCISSTEGVAHRPIFDKNVQVKQLSVVEAHGILLIRADKGKSLSVVKNVL